MPDISVNVKNAVNALKAMNSNVDLAVKMATSRVAVEAESEIKKQIQPVFNDGHRRPDGRTTSAKIGGPPMTRTGDLRASVGYSVTRKGFGSYVAIVGPTVVYSRAVELGAPNWKQGVKYPYLAPAVRKLNQSNRIRDIYMSTMKAAL